MDSTIVVAGASGNLGGRIVSALVGRGAEVSALVREGTEGKKLSKLGQPGVKIVEVDLSDRGGLTRACEGASCVVSVVQGLREVIVDAQAGLLDAAIAAGVPRFIPSDYSADFTKLSAGENRNFDLRLEFRERLSGAKIASTSILNGAFAELLTWGMPLLDLSAKRVSYWGDADQKLDFTTMDDTASFTAAAALDPSAPAILRIAGDEISPRGLASLAGDLTHSTFELVRSGSLDELAALIHHLRAADPEGENQVFPKWQGLQYMHNMFSGRAKLGPLDNDRYPGLTWTRVRDLLAAKVATR
jgi:nucleoside-diphosphate-sugar epimerase